MTDSPSPTVFWWCPACNIAESDGHFCPRCRRLCIPATAEELEGLAPAGVVWANPREGAGQDGR